MSYDDDIYGDVQDEVDMIREGNPHRSRRRMGDDAGCLGVIVILAVMGIAAKVLWEWVTK